MTKTEYDLQVDVFFEWLEEQASLCVSQLSYTQSSRHRFVSPIWCKAILISLDIIPEENKDHHWHSFRRRYTTTFESAFKNACANNPRVIFNAQMGCYQTSYESG